MPEISDVRKPIVPAISVLVCGVLASVTLSAQAQSSDEVNKRLESEREQMMSCVVNLRDDPKFGPLYAKLPFDESGKSLPLEVLANKTKPSPKEKVILSAFSLEKERCLDIGNEWRRHVFPPDAIALYAVYRLGSLAVLTDLYAGKIGFGEAVKLRVSQASTYDQDLEALRRKYQAQSEAYEKQRLNDEAIARAQKEAAAQQQAQNEAREREIEYQRKMLENQQLALQQAQERANQQARREQASQQMSQGLMLLQQAMPKLDPMPRSPSINCQSRSAFGTVYTNCN